MVCALPNDSDSTDEIPELVLASSSIYRRNLLDKLTIPYRCYSPDIDETPLSAELPEQLVKRLALSKARAAATDHPRAFIIGSDQVAVLAGDIITKPGNHLQAKAQLQRASGQAVTFLTGLCLLNGISRNYQLRLVPYTVHFLSLTDKQIEHYLEKEKPYDCAGSFKSEGLGITLCAGFEGEDPNALIGLPLIALTDMLRNEGIEPLFS